MLKDFFKFVKYYGQDKKTQITVFLLLSTLAGLLEFVGIGLVYPFLTLVINPPLASKFSVLTKLLERFDIPADSFAFVVGLGFVIIALFVLKNLLMIFCLYKQNKFVMDWKFDICKTIMNFYLKAPYSDMLKNSSSDKIYNLTTLPLQALEIFVIRFFIATTNVIICILILSLLFIKFPQVAILTLGFVGISMLILNNFFKNKTKEISPEILDTSIKNNAQVIENINNLKLIRIFSTEDFFLNKYKNTLKQNNNALLKNIFYSSIPPYLVEIILIISLILLAGIITYQNYGNMTKIVASYGLILAIIFRIAPSLNRIQMALNQMNSHKKMIQKMNNEYETYFCKNIINTAPNDKKITYTNELKVNNISYGYNENELVLKNCTFEIKKGDFIGIIGLSGAGKTTLINILMGLLPPKTGEILLDGAKIDDSNITPFRKIIGYVPQEISILSGDTYANNVAWGCQASEINEQKVIECLKQAQLYDFVESNGGINSVIEGLSQGQMQRLLIARALYRNPKIIVFDEATSSLDLETEHEITKMLTSIKGMKTIVAIAHRLSTLKECNKLIYLKDGEIADVGTFEELENRHEDFKNLIKLSQI